MISDHVKAIVVIIIVNILAVLTFIFTEFTSLSLTAVIAATLYNLISQIYSIWKIKQEERGIKPVEWYERKIVNRPTLIVLFTAALVICILLTFTINWKLSGIKELIFVYICIYVCVFTGTGIYHLSRKK